jgi:hypothetical protein
MEVSGQIHAPAALSPLKESWYEFDKRLGGPQGQNAVAKKKSLALSRIYTRSSSP